MLSKSQIYAYTVNPYGGCAFACSFCYARFMKRFTGHKEPWGEYVDVKVNAPELLAKEAEHKKPGEVWISGVCDPYQPLEAKYGLTRRCLQILLDKGWGVRVQTRSPLVLRDIDLLSSGDVEVTLSITTSDDRIRRIFEPKAPPIRSRLRAFDRLCAAGVRTNVMVAPLLPGARGLGPRLAGKANLVLIDRMNYSYAAHLYREHRIEDAMTDRFFADERDALLKVLKKAGTPCQPLF